MRLKKVAAVLMTTAMVFSMTACGGGDSNGSSGGTTSKKTTSESSSAGGSENTESTGTEDYTTVELGKTGTDIKTTIKMLTHRTDMLKDDYNGTSYKQYLAEFNKMYPNITVDIEGVTDYAEDSLLRLQGGDWGDIMMIPAVDASEYSKYFLPMGNLTDMEKLVRFASNQQYQGVCYGIPTTGNAQGVLYNKAVFEKAGIKELPATPEEFIEDLKLIKANTDAIPLYTNYAAGWTMGAWDGYIAGSATGDSTYENQKLAHTKNPFSDQGDGSHAYNE